MLKGCKMAFLGGDARQIEVIRHCSTLGASIVLYGYETLKNEFPGTIKKSITPDIFTDVDAIVLPIRGMQNDGKLESCFATKELILHEEHFARAKKNTLVFTGIAENSLKLLCEQNQLTLIELMELDEVAILNSIPTAEGAIFIAIQNTDFTIHDANCFVLGLGRVGTTLANKLRALGAKVYLGARKVEDLARAQEMGLISFHINDLDTRLPKADIVFNTIPALILDSVNLLALPPHALIVDLASKPGGTDFQFAQKRGIQAILAPGLPGIVAPKTAGKIIAKSLSRLIQEHNQKLGGEK